LVILGFELWTSHLLSRLSTTWATPPVIFSIFLEFFIYFGYLSSIRWMTGRCFFPFCRLSLHSVDYLLCCIEDF
jgi:hypothetical protein